jgi:hypothetical protein
MTGVPLNKKRTIVRGISVVLMYVADNKPRPEPQWVNVNLQTALEVIKAGIPM